MARERACWLYISALGDGPESAQLYASYGGEIGAQVATEIFSPFDTWHDLAVWARKRLLELPPLPLR